MLKKIAVFKRILFDALGHYNDDDGWAMSSHVALSSLMALFPFLIFAGTLAAFLGADAFSETAVHLIFDTWPKSIADPIAREVQNVLTVPRGGLLTVSIIAAAYFAASGIEALRVALNRAYREKETRSLLFRRTQSLLFVIVAALGMAAISFLLVLAPLAVHLATKWLPWIDSYTYTISFWRFLIAIVVLIFGLFAVHLWLPDGNRPFRYILPGIVITLVAWVVSALVFASYLARFANYFSTYAGLASIMVAMVFLYILSSIFIVGAEINAAIHLYAESRKRISRG
ncbi:MAG: YihY/virulence factor BrkB family protein [Rhizobiaceae bacterium]